MSHVVSIATQITDVAALQAACRRLGLPPPVHGTAQLFAAPATGQIVELPGWTYPAVIDTTARQIRFDTYEGRWGDPKELGRLLQAYAIEKCRIEARKAGHTLIEEPLPEGAIKLTIELPESGGGA